MHLVQVLLPLYDNDGEPFDPELYADVRMELTRQFGGVTTFVRAPARGLWQKDDGSVTGDDIVVYEVMVEDLDEGWWASCRERLRQRFEQDQLIVRALALRML
jgi:hypothetical protein